MAEKKSKKIFEEDLTVFETTNLKPVREDGVGIRNPTVQARRSKRVQKTQSAKELETLIKNLQALGYRITPASSSQDQQRQEESLEKLGFIGEQTSKKPSAPPSPTEITITLGAAHIVGGVQYGPGEVILPSSESALIQSLMHQDQMCRNGHFDTSQYQPYSRCYLIRPGDGVDTHNKYRKLEVTEGQLNQAFAGEDLVNIGVTAGQFDIAGYNPNFNQENRSF